MGFIEEKERLAGLDAESGLRRIRADFDGFWRAFADGHGRSELDRALDTARSIAEGEYDTQTRRRARRLAIAAREKFTRRAEAHLDRTDVSAPTDAYLHLLAETFLADSTIVDDRFVALAARLRMAAIRSQFAGLSEADQRTVYGELGAAMEGD
jgi:hypothetical protein